MGLPAAVPVAIAAGLIMAALGACAPSGHGIDRWAPAAVDRFDRHYLELLRTGRLREARSHLDARMSAEAADTGLRHVADFLASTAPFGSVHVVGVAVNLRNTGARYTRLTYELRVGRSWRAAEMWTMDSAAARTVISIRVEPLQESLERSNRFTLAGKSLGHYLLLLWVALDLGIVALAVVRCARSPLRRKWAWLLLTLVGATSFTMDWSSGETGFSFFSVLFMGVAFVKVGPAVPWAVSAGIPVGALLVLRKLTRPDEPVFGRLRARRPPARLVLRDPPPAPAPSPEEWILRALAMAGDAGAAVRQIRWYAAERTAFGGPAAALAAALEQLALEGRIRREGERWYLVAPAAAGMASPADVRPPALSGDAAPADC